MTILKWQSLRTTLPSYSRNGLEEVSENDYTYGV